MPSRPADAAMRVLSVVGARPQFVKLKPVSAALHDAGHSHAVVHTGQHYDADMSDSFFDGLGLPAPIANLGAGSGTHAVQTATIMAALEPVLSGYGPDWVLVYGDTNSTLAATLVAAKAQVPVAHVEAGLRSWNRAMPEELNRVLTDHASDLLLAPTANAMANLESEGLSSRAHLVGDVMADLAVAAMRDLDASSSEAGRATRAPYLVATIHRASNTDDGRQLAALVRALAGLDVPVLLVAHPRLIAAAQRERLALATGAIKVLAPLPYMEMLRLVAGAIGVVTDSGGLQKEAYLLGVPCTTLRSETEWPETLEGGMNALDPTGQRLASLAIRRAAPARSQPFGDGGAAARIVALLQDQRTRGRGQG